MEGLQPDMQEEVLDFVHFLKAKRSNMESATVKPIEDNGLKAVEILNELAARGTAFQDIAELKGIAPNPQHIVSLEEMNNAIQLEGAKL